MQGEREKISVIVPIYNQEHYLEKCLYSLYAQTYKNIEFILVDDGSTDSSAELCKSFCDRDSRFVYLYQENGGVSSARNAGLKIAKGAYIGFCDGDDWVEPDAYEFLYNLIVEKGADVAICGYETSNDAKRQLESIDVVLSIPQAISSLYGHEYNCYGYLWNKLIRRDRIDSITFNTQYALYEDMVFMCKVYCASQKVAYRNCAKYHYTVNEDSALHGIYREVEWSGQAAQRELISIVKEAFPEVLPVAQKGMIQLSLRLVDRMVFSHNLSKENYNRVIIDIKSCINRMSLALMTKSRKMSLRLLLRSKVLYIIFRKFFRRLSKR